MVEVVRAFIVREKARGHFELAYGPGGAWSQLLSRAPGFRGITLMRDVQDARRYLAIEVWETEARREQALAEHPGEYAALESSLDGWCESRSEVGVFRLLAQATVRPRS